MAFGTKYAKTFDGENLVYSLRTTVETKTYVWSFDGCCRHLAFQISASLKIDSHQTRKDLKADPIL